MRNRKRARDIEEKPQIKLSHDKLLRKMYLLGCTAYSDNDGACHGVTCMAAHAILSENTKQFNDQLALTQQLTRAKGKGQHEERAFLEGISLCQQPKRYPQLFATPPQQNPLITIPLIASKQLEQQGTLSYTAKFSGVYNRAELIKLFELLRKGAQKFPHPFVLTISDIEHIIAVTFDCDENHWAFVDVESLPLKKFDSDKEVAKAVVNAVSTEANNTVISLNVMVTETHASASRKMMSHCKSQSAWHDIHSLERKNGCYFRWLLLSACDGCYAETKLLLEHGVAPNRDNGLPSPLYAATKHGHEAIIKLLESYDAVMQVGEPLSLVKCSR